MVHGSENHPFRRADGRPCILAPVPAERMHDGLVSGDEERGGPGVGAETRALAPGPGYHAAASHTGTLGGTEGCSAMVHHVVLFRFRSDLPEGAVAEVFEELRGFRPSIPGITGFQGGAYNSPEGLAQGFTHGFTMTFADAASRDAYLPHPLHQALVAKLLPMLEGGLQGVVAFDFIDGVMG